MKQQRSWSVPITFLPVVDDSVNRKLEQYVLVYHSLIESFVVLNFQSWRNNGWHGRYRSTVSTSIPNK